MLYLLFGGRARAHHGLLDSSSAVFSYRQFCHYSGHYSRTASYNAPVGWSGDLTVFVVTDSANQVGEFAEDNNEAQAPLHVDTPADLIPEVLSLQASADGGHSIGLSYRLVNAGESPTRGPSAEFQNIPRATVKTPPTPRCPTDSVAA